MGRTFSLDNYVHVVHTLPIEQGRMDMTKPEAINIQKQRWMDGAERYARADRSDPFALARAMTHIRNGIVGLRSDGYEACYSADEHMETRTLPDGMKFSNGDTDYQVRTYRNITRP